MLRCSRGMAKGAATQDSLGRKCPYQCLRLPPEKPRKDCSLLVSKHEPFPDFVADLSMRVIQIFKC